MSSSPCTLLLKIFSSSLLFGLDFQSTVFGSLETPETAAPHVALKMCLLATNSAVTEHRESSKKPSNKNSPKGEGDAFEPELKCKRTIHQ